MAGIQSAHPQKSEASLIGTAVAFAMRTMSFPVSMISVYKPLYETRLPAFVCLIRTDCQVKSVYKTKSLVLEPMGQDLNAGV